MNLAWAKEWMGSFNAAGLEKALGMYAEDVAARLLGCQHGAAAVEGEITSSTSLAKRLGCGTVQRDSLFVGA